MPITEASSTAEGGGEELVGQANEEVETLLRDLAKSHAEMWELLNNRQTTAGKVFRLERNAGKIADYIEARVDPSGENAIEHSAIREIEQLRKVRKAYVNDFEFMNTLFEDLGLDLFPLKPDEDFIPHQYLRGRDWEYLMALKTEDGSCLESILG